MGKKEEKTNVMRTLDQKKVPYIPHLFDADTRSGEEIAKILGEDPSRVFKTLVTTGKTGQHYVFDIPVNEELDLKKAAKAVGEKSIDMLPQKELLPLTGYIHGGCSPIGMKKKFPTFIHNTAESLEKIYVSAGKVGYQIELLPSDLITVAECKLADIIS
jgi:Cys-tRNA(Pro)/Cys-tRNA(Cys) deacylase